MTKKTGEVEFYRDAGVTVTSARFSTNGQTIAMSGVTSVSIHKDPVGPIEVGCLITGLPLLYWGFTSPDARSVLLLGFALVGFAAWIIGKPIYSLVLTSNSGRKKMLKTKNKERLVKIAAAVEDAVIYRG